MSNHVTPADDDDDAEDNRTGTRLRGENIELFTAERLLNVNAFAKLLCGEVMLHINQCPPLSTEQPTPKGLGS